VFASSLRGLLLFCIVASSGAGPLAADLRKPPPRHVLRAAQTWHLDPPDGARFDASALLIQPDGSLLTVNDKVPGIYRIGFGKDGTARLTAIPGALTPPQLAPFASAKHGPYDCEGLARDDDGRIYICEEGDRWILRFDPKAGSVERLPIDWSPVKRWSSSDRNASFEGIAVGGGVLYVANEREVGRIITVDLATMKVVDSFQVTPIGNPARDVHYSDLGWADGELWVLCRESRCVLRVDPRTRRVLAQFDYLELETSRPNAYAHPYPYGFVEGLAVDPENIWLVVDNNGFPRVADAADRRPTLWRCPRPDRTVPKQ
jgi:streptogramin lyase